MNMAERRYQPPTPPPPHHRRKAPSFSSSLLDSILRSIDDDTHLQHHHHHDYDHDLDLMSEPPKRSTKIHLINNEQEQTPSSTLRRAIIIDQWMDNRNSYNTNNPKFSWDSSSSAGTTTFTTTSSETETPSTYRSLPNSFTISRDPDHDAQKAKPKFMKSTRLRAMKIYADLKKVKQPISPGSRISAFIYSLFASSSSSSSSSKKSKLELDSIRSLKKSRSIKQQQQQQQDSCTSFTRSCMSKKQQHSVKRSVRFYPDSVLDNDRKSKSYIHDQRVPDSKYERRRGFTDKNNANNNYMVEDDDEDEDDLFELEIVGGVAYRQELPVFETTDLSKIMI